MFFVAASVPAFFSCRKIVYRSIGQEMMAAFLSWIFIVDGRAVAGFRCGGCSIFDRTFDRNSFLPRTNELGTSNETIRGVSEATDAIASVFYVAPAIYSDVAMLGCRELLECRSTFSHRIFFSNAMFLRLFREHFTIQPKKNCLSTFWSFYRK